MTLSATKFARENSLINHLTSIWIQEMPGSSQYQVLFCMFCGTPYMQTDGIVVQIIPGEVTTGVGVAE